MKHQGSGKSKGSAAGNRSAGSGAKKSVKSDSSSSSCQVDNLAAANGGRCDIYDGQASSCRLSRPGGANYAGQWLPTFGLPTNDPYAH